MAQETEKEDVEYKVVLENITGCVNCGVTGIPATSKMCQKCVAASSAGVAIKFGEKSPRSMSSPERTSDLPESSRGLKRGCAIAGIGGVEEETSVRLPAVVKSKVNRCCGCGKKVGLTGFRCRCGYLFCGEHRYSDRHDCSYDYKAVGRAAIARENPVFKAAKIIKL